MPMLRAPRAIRACGGASCQGAGCGNRMAFGTGVDQPELLDLLEGGESHPRAKHYGSALRRYLDLDRAEGRRRHAIRKRQSFFRRALGLSDAVAVAATLFLGAEL